MIKYYENPPGTDQPPLGQIVTVFDGLKYQKAIRISGNFYFVGVTAEWNREPLPL